MIQQQASNFSKAHITVAYAGLKYKDIVFADFSAYFNVKYKDSVKKLQDYINDQSLLSLPEIIIIEVDEKGECFELIRGYKSNPLLKGVIIILLAEKSSKELTNHAMSLKVHDLYTLPLPTMDICERVNFLVKFKLTRPKLLELSNVDVSYHIDFKKRIFDVFFSALALIILFPFLLLIALLIRLESKGPVIYKSKRVGTGYKTFDFYKFRSMHIGAEAELDTLSENNQYISEEDGNNGTFIKIKNDPRITWLGNFIRNTSIDELPQLYNVLIGDMSLVGNRPLPLYEAEMLTSNEWSMRFLGPAGLTGLWQISKRGKGRMSERERKQLDNFYAENHSFMMDMKILIKTLPAIIQKEKV